MKMMISTILLVALALTPLPASALYSSNDDVVELTPSNFDRLVINDDAIWVVEFYAPWCGHCKSLVPEFKKVATALKGVVKVGSVNADEHRALGGQYDVKGFPTIKIFGTKSRVRVELCGDCGSSDPSWVSINRGTLLCSDCCSIHRSLGRHISIVKSLRQSTWEPSVLNFVNSLNSHGANSVWEHHLLDTNSSKNDKGVFRVRKPNPKDPLHPTKSDFIKSKHVNLAFVLKSNLQDEGVFSEFYDNCYCIERTKMLVNLCSSPMTRTYLKSLAKCATVYRGAITLEADPYLHFHPLLNSAAVRALARHLLDYHTMLQLHVRKIVPVLCALRFYATGCYQRTVGEQWGISMSQTSISRCIHRVTDAINSLMFFEEIKFPMSQAERQAAKEVFSAAPAPFVGGTIGAIDCTHISILAPSVHEEAYVNHHSYHSLNVQMICDPNLKILNINAKFPGDRHDACIWSSCAVRLVMQREHENGNRNIFLIGDSGYPLKPWLMTPLPNEREGTAKFRYNEALCKARNLIERLFGVLKATWRCLSRQRVLLYEPGFAGKVVNACATLHNVRLAERSDELDNIGIVLDMHTNDITSSASSVSSAGKRAQERLISNFFT